MSDTQKKDMYGKNITNAKSSFPNLKICELHLVYLNWYLVGLQTKESDFWEEREDFTQLWFQDRENDHIKNAVAQARC